MKIQLACGIGFVMLCGMMASAQEVVPDDVTGVTPVVTDEEPMSFWMAKKLEYSKDMLQALTSSDYETLQKKLEQMRLLAGIEGFMRGRNPTYTAHLRSFNMACFELKQHAKKQDIQAATEAFNKMTTSCVACHQTLRQATDSPAKP